MTDMERIHDIPYGIQHAVNNYTFSIHGDRLERMVEFYKELATAIKKDPGIIGDLISAVDNF